MRWPWQWFRCDRTTEEEKTTMSGVDKARAVYERQFAAAESAEITREAIHENLAKIRAQRTQNGFGAAVFDAMHRKG